jgi:hypothetical protein
MSVADPRQVGLRGLGASHRSGAPRDGDHQTTRSPYPYEIPFLEVPPCGWFTDEPHPSSETRKQGLTPLVSTDSTDIPTGWARSHRPAGTRNIGSSAVQAALFRVLLVQAHSIP